VNGLKELIPKGDLKRRKTGLVAEPVKVTAKRESTPKSQDGSASSPSRVDSACNAECPPLFRLTGEELLRSRPECPRLPDNLCEIPGKRRPLWERLLPWQESVYPDLRFLRERISSDISQ
jgi:hypothetical protein